MSDNPPYIFADDFCEHQNIGWRIEPGKADPANPLIEPKFPWDSAAAFVSPTVLKDPTDGLWKAWGLSQPIDPDIYAPAKGRLAYAFSQDGSNWTRPALAGHPCLGHKETNVLIDLDPTGHTHYVSVFIHPDRPDNQRYEMFTMHSRGALPNGMYRYFSSDGLEWRRASERLPIETADSIFVYDGLDAPYAAYHKKEIPAFPGALVPCDVGAGNLRMLVRRTSQDGIQWSDPPETIMTPDWRDAHDTQFMDIGPLAQGRGYVATVTVYHALNGTIDLQFAASPDARRWWRPARRPCVANGALGDYGGAMLWPARQMVEDDGRLYLYYCAMQGEHGDLYTTQPNSFLDYGALCRTSWQKGRLWAAAPSAGGPTQGVLTTTPISDCAGKRLIVNAMTTEDGELSAELVGGNEWVREEPIDGFTRGDCRLFRGNSKSAPLVWESSDRCPKDKLMIRFFLRKARLYGFEWR